MALSELAGLGLEIYHRIPDYRDRCPLCQGKDCAVRHGLYRRRVVDVDGLLVEDFPVPRFRCRRRGPKAAPAVTFSVLPADLVTRRLCSLPFMLWVLELFLVADRSMSKVLDAITASFFGGALPWLAEAATVYRMVRLFSYVATRLERSAWPGLGLRPAAEPRTRALKLVRMLKASSRASPPVLAFHVRYFPRLLFESPRAAS